MKTIRGFTLIELMITVLIIGFLIAMAMPNYITHTKRAARAEAIMALLDAANKQEQYFVDNRQYSSSLSDLGILQSTDNGYFKLSVIVTDATYILKAQPIAGPVKNDADCNELTLTDTGLKASLGQAPTDYCWSE